MKAWATLLKPWRFCSSLSFFLVWTRSFSFHDCSWNWSLRFFESIWYVLILNSSCCNVWICWCIVMIWCSHSIWSLNCNIKCLLEMLSLIQVYYYGSFVVFDALHYILWKVWQFVVFFPLSVVCLLSIEHVNDVVVGVFIPYYLVWHFDSEDACPPMSRKWQVFNRAQRMNWIPIIIVIIFKVCIWIVVFIDVWTIIILLILMVRGWIGQWCNWCHTVLNLTPLLLIIWEMANL